MDSTQIIEELNRKKEILEKEMLTSPNAKVRAEARTAISEIQKQLAEANNAINVNRPLVKNAERIGSDDNTGQFQNSNINTDCIVKPLLALCIVAVASAAIFLSLALCELRNKTTEELSNINSKVTELESKVLALTDNLSVPTLGIAGLNVRDLEDEVEFRDIYDNDISEGVFVVELFDNGAAEKAGMMPGIVVYKVNGTRVVDMTGLKEILGRYKEGDKVTVDTYVPDLENSDQSEPVFMEVRFSNVILGESREKATGNTR